MQQRVDILSQQKFQQLSGVESEEIQKVTEYNSHLEKELRDKQREVDHNPELLRANAQIKMLSHENADLMKKVKYLEDKENCDQQNCYQAFLNGQHALIFSSLNQSIISLQTFLETLDLKLDALEVQNSNSLLLEQKNVDVEMFEDECKANPSGINDQKLDALTEKLSLSELYLEEEREKNKQLQEEIQDQQAEISRLKQKLAELKL